MLTDSNQCPQRPPSENELSKLTSLTKPARATPSSFPSREKRWRSVKAAPPYRSVNHSAAVGCAPTTSETNVAAIATDDLAGTIRGTALLGPQYYRLSRLVLQGLSRAPLFGRDR